jgi:hypothetical protein
MQADGQVIFQIEGDNKGLKSTLQDTTSAIQSESKKWDNAASSSAQGMESSFSGALKNMAAAFSAAQVGKMLLDFGKAAINAASDLQEVQNVVDVTFGESANEINAWAKNAINQFGLTETQAKRFASTMGAMMKSSGIASKDITEMSENLAGLSADMASFYNLDFDEAFNKIRSGISGETEPLKQLGINMSVANLEAFALSQGLKKTFNEMSQGEQVMLRYQYLMQATADAQGDFSRTSDGFANGLRLLQNNFESLKTTIGTALIEPVSRAIGFLNEMMGLLNPESKQKTVLDDFANIDLQTQQKLQAIQDTKAEADALILVLRDIESANLTDKSGVISNMAGGANKLSENAGKNWANFLDGLDGVSDAITATAGGVVAGINLSGLANGAKELTGTPETQFKYDKLPGKIQELLNKANKADTAKKDLTTIDDEAGKLTKDEQTKFKFGKLITDLDDLETATSDAATDVPTEVNKLDAEMKDITTDQKTGFKFSKYEGDIAGLETKTGDAAKGVETEVGNLDSAMKDVTTDDNTTGFKFSKYEKDAEGLVTKTGEAATGVAEKIDNLDSEMSDITTDDNTTGFKFSKYESDVEGLVTKTGEAAKGVETEVGNIDKATADITTAQDTDFKYDDLKSDVKSLNDEMATAATDLQGNVSAVNQATESIVGKIRMLDSTSRNNWVSVLNVFKKIPGYAKELNAEKIEGIANAFAGLKGDKAEAWKTLMEALGSDLSALATLTGTDENSAAKWLSEMKEAANGLDNGSVAEWNALFSLLANGAPGAGNYITPEDMANLAKSAGLSSGEVDKLGNATTSAAERNELWLKTCKRLVQLMPELNSIINTETGEIKGGITAIQEYADAWEESNRRIILSEALKKKQQAYTNKVVELGDYELAYRKAFKARENFEKDNAELVEKYRKNGILWLNEEIRDGNSLAKTYRDLIDEVNNTGKAYQEQSAGVKEAKEELALMKDVVEETTSTVDQGTSSVKEYGEEAKKAAADGVQALGDALKEVNDYVERTKKSTEDSIDSALKGFKKYQLAADHIKELEKNQKSTTDENGMLVGVDDTVPSLNKMKDALDNQAKFMDEYRGNLAIAKSKGISEDLLAEFASDFSQESADFLHLIATAGDDELKAFKASYQKMADAKDPLVKSMTELKLQADDEFQEMVARVKQAAADLNNSEVAQESMAATVQGIANGIAEKVPEVKEAVDALNAELSRLGSMQDYDVFGGLSSGGGFSFKFTTDGSFANGTDYVPFDNYLAYLHEGESVLTAEEAAMWRNFKSGGSNLRNNIDYGQLSGAIWDNAPNMGGNVYLDGRTVGKVISAQQANSYRQLERSGWQG